MCRAHAAVRQLVGGMLEEKSVTAIVDTEAGLEHLSRGTARHVDTLVVMMEPYYRALETARRTAELGKELGIARVVAVANKVRDDLDRKTIEDYARSHGLEVIGEIPYDDDLRRAEQKRVAPLETNAKALAGMEKLAAALVT